jgi:hypothetical protein
MDYKDYKVIILSLVRSHPRRELTIADLNQDLLKTEHIDLMQGNLIRSLINYLN